MDIESTIEGLPIDLHDIKLVRGAEEIIGKGIVSVNPSGVIELKVFPDNPPRNTIESFFKSYNQSQSDAGKLLTQEDYFSFKGIAVNNDHYFSSRLSITDHFNFKVYTLEFRSDLVITNDPKQDTFQTVRIQIPYRIKLPTNHSSEIEKKYSDKWISRSVSRNIFEINIEDMAIDIFSTADKTNILIQKSDTIISETDIGHILTAVEFITSSIIDRYSLEYKEKGIYRREFRYSRPQRIEVTKGSPPLSISMSRGNRDTEELFVKFYQFIKNHGQMPIAEIIRRVISAQNTFITSYALTIATAIEEILHSYYSTGKSEFSESDIGIALSELEKTNIGDLIKRRLVGMINNLLRQERADDIIKELIKKGRLQKGYYDKWKKLRNSVSHGKDATSDFQEYLNLCKANLVFFHMLVLQLIGYTGRYTDYSTYGYPILDLK